METAYFSVRMVIMTAHPGTNKASFEVDLDREDIVTSEGFVDVTRKARSVVRDEMVIED